MIQEAKKLMAASKLAVNGMITATVAFVLSMIYNFVTLGDQTKMTYDALPDEQKAALAFDTYQSVVQITMVVSIFIGLALIGTMLYLSFRMRKAKGKAIPITLVVMSSLYLMMSLIGLTAVFSALSITIIFSLANIVGFSLVLWGAIQALNAPKEEYEFNRLAL